MSETRRHPRLAWFTPLPPTSSGVAHYNAELLPALADTHHVDVFVDEPPGSLVHPPGTRVHSAHDFVWRHLQQPYDLVVYQLGNSPCHDYMWAYLTRYPGMVVLHDGQLHHARGRALLRRKRDDDYRAEFQFNHPDTDPVLAELGIAGLLGSLTYLWPMRRVVVDTCRSVVVHSGWLADDIRAEHPGAHVDVVTMGVPATMASDLGGDAIRRRHGIASDAVVFATLGNVTPEKRVSQALHAVATLAPTIPGVHLLLAGRGVDHYDAEAEARALGVAGRVTIAGFVPDHEVADYLAAADVCLCLRWPTSRETSAAWLRCLAAGRATVVSDLVHMVDVPSFDPRNWSILHAAGGAPDPALPDTPAQPACVSIDILDEDHSLRLAMRRLATDPRLRETLASSGLALWRERFTLERMVEGYRRVIAVALETPPPEQKALPEHFRVDGTEKAAALLRQLGVSEERIVQMWQPLRTEPF